MVDGWWFSELIFPHYIHHHLRSYRILCWVHQSVPSHHISPAHYILDFTTGWLADCSLRGDVCGHEIKRRKYLNFYITFEWLRCYRSLGLYTRPLEESQFSLACITTIYCLKNNKQVFITFSSTRDVTFFWLCLASPRFYAHLVSQFYYFVRDCCF